MHTIKQLSNITRRGTLYGGYFNVFDYYVRSNFKEYTIGANEISQINKKEDLLVLPEYMSLIVNHIDNNKYTFNRHMFIREIELPFNDKNFVMTRNNNGIALVNKLRVSSIAYPTNDENSYLKLKINFFGKKVNGLPAIELAKEMNFYKIIKNLERQQEDHDLQLFFEKMG